MSNPSPRSHLYRLGILLAAGFIGLLVIRAVATPSSWNSEVWYRGDALKDASKQALVHGGNDSCRDCHADEVKRVMKLKHKTLSCEGCHGPLTDHARGGEKIAAAKVVDQSRWQCLNCHSELSSKPRDFPQFTHEVKKHKTLEEGTVCLKCHDAHDPTP